MILSFVGLGIFVIIDVRVCVFVCVQMKENEETRRNFGLCQL
jgi:hypothetical protein